MLYFTHHNPIKMTTPNADLLEQAKEEIATQEYAKYWHDLTDSQRQHEVDNVAHRYYELMSADNLKRIEELEGNALLNRSENAYRDSQ